jgi:O-antigen/teichoic acid export membrane protein
MLAWAGIATAARVAKKPLRGVLRGIGRFTFDAGSMIAERGSLVVLAAFTLTGALSPLAAMMLFAVTRVLDTGVCALYVHRRVVRLVPDFDPETLGRVARSVVPFAVTAASWLLYNHADSLMLGAMVGAQAVGEYVVVYRLFEGLLVVPLALCGALLPRLSRAHADGDPAAADALLDRGLRVVLYVAAPVVAAALVAPGEILSVLYGAAYEEAAGGLAILLGATPFVFVFWLLRSAFVALRRTRTIAWLGFGTLVANIAANLIMIPRFGVTGACLTTIACEVAACAGAVALLRRAGMSLAFVRPAALSLLSAFLVAGAMVLSRAAVGIALAGLPLGVAAAHAVTCRAGYWLADERARLARWRLAW